MIPKDLTLTVQSGGIAFPPEVAVMPEIKALVDEKKDELFHYRRLGMKAKHKATMQMIRRRTMAILAEADGMALLQLRNWGDGDYDVYRITPEGKRIDQSPSSESGYFKKFKFKKFEGNIPATILEKLPDNAGKIGRIFEFKRGKDPIYAIPLGHTGYWLGVFQWK